MTQRRASDDDESGGSSGKSKSSGKSSRGSRSSQETISTTQIGSYAIAASKTGAEAAVKAIKAAEPLPQLKGKLSKLTIAALQKWMKAVARHESMAGQTMATVIGKMVKMMDYEPEQVVVKTLEELNLTEADIVEEDVMLAGKLQDSLSTEMWEMIGPSECASGSAIITGLLGRVVNRSHRVTSTRIEEMTKINDIKWASGLSAGLTVFAAAMQEVMYTIYFTYDLAMETLVDLLYRFQPMVHRLMLFWGTLTGVQDEDDYKHRQSKHWDKMMTLLWELVEVAEHKAKKGGSRPREWATNGKGGKGEAAGEDSAGKNGGKGSKGGKGKGSGKCWAFAEGNCQFGSKCKYQHEAKVKAAKWVEEDEETTEVKNRLTFRKRIFTRS